MNEALPNEALPMAQLTGNDVAATGIVPAEAVVAEPAAGPAPASAGTIGVLLVNLGTPDAADAPAVRRYLKEFLTDARVIENQGPLWDLVLNGIILPIRP